MSKKIFFCHLILLLNFSSSVLLAQQYQGLNTSNYSGLTSIYENPANIADSRFALDITLISADFNFNNNYIAFSNGLFASENNPIADEKYNDKFQLFRDENFFEKTWSQMNQTRIYQSLNIQGPSFMFNIGKNAFAITSGVRQYMHIDNLDPRTADFLLSELLDQNNWNVDLDNKKFNVLGAAWGEFGLAYGREIINTGEHFLKGAVHLKALIAMYSAHFYADELSINFRNDDTLRVRVSDVRFGYSDDLKHIKADMDDGDVGTFFANMFNKGGFAADFGFVYEWRPKHKEYGDPKDKKEWKKSRHLNKYKLKVGFSVADLGAVHFDRGNNGGNFSGFSGEWDLDTFAAATQGVAAFADLMNDTFNMPTNTDPYAIRLPTTLSLQVDYNIYKWFYINLSGRLAIDQEDAPLKMHALNTLTLTPRFEWKQIDFGVPISIDGFNNVTAGMFLRLGPLFVGSTNCWNMIVGPSMHGINLYGGLTIPILFPKKKKPKELKPKEEEPVVTVEPKKEEEPLDSIAEAKKQEEIERKAEADREWIAEQERLAREKEEPEPEPEPQPEPEPEPEPQPEPEPEPEPQPEPEPEPEPEYYEVKETETAIKESRAFFQSGSAWVSSAGRRELDKVVQKVLSDESYHLIIHGHTDNVGDPESNKKLAAKRANAVKKYLMEQGVKDSRIEIVAHGDAKNVAENDTEVGRGLNRRVEVLLLKDK